MTSDEGALREALSALNAKYGRGDVRQVRLRFDGRGDFTRAVASGQFRARIEIRRFRIEHDTVHALRHQLKLKK